jgi:hypothetical protein
MFAAFKADVSMIVKGKSRKHLTFVLGFGYISITMDQFQSAKHLFSIEK